MIKLDASDLLAKLPSMEKLVANKALELTQKVTLDVHANVVRASPVDTGAFRGAWTAETPTQPFDSGKVENTAEYGPALVNGHSTQAPTGWLQNSIEAATKL